MDELVLGLIWQRVGFWGCALMTVVTLWGMFYVRGPGADNALFMALISFIAMCFFGMHY